MNPQNQKIFRLFVFLLVLIWCIGIIWEIIVYFFPSAFVLLPFLKYNYSLVCHTDPEKLYSIGNFTTMTCSRCTGIYFGALISSIIILLGIIKKVDLKILLLSSIPMFVDVILYSIGIYNYSHFVALLTGLLLGSVGIIYIQNTIIELFTNKKEKN